MASYTYKRVYLALEAASWIDRDKGAPVNTDEYGTEITTDYDSNLYAMAADYIHMLEEELGSLKQRIAKFDIPSDKERAASAQ